VRERVNSTLFQRHGCPQQRSARIDDEMSPRVLIQLTGPRTRSAE
jgi:hypothetical protein